MHHFIKVSSEDKFIQLSKSELFEIEGGAMITIPVTVTAATKIARFGAGLVIGISRDLRR